MFVRSLLVGCLFLSSLAVAQSTDGKTHAVLRVDTVKPSLVRRDYLTLQGEALGEATGGWTYAVDAQAVGNKIVLTLDGSAAAGVVVGTTRTPFKTAIEVAALKDKKTGAYQLEVKGPKGDVLWSGSWIDGAVKDVCPLGEHVENRGTRSQFCAPTDGKCAAGRKAIVTPVSNGTIACVPDTAQK